MKVIHYPQSYGKTTAIVEMARAVDGIVVARNQASKQYIKSKWPDAIVVVLDELSTIAIGDRQLFIDDADQILKDLFAAKYVPNEIACISLTMERPY